MFSWIKNAVANIGSWLGDGIGSFFGWLFGGIGTLLTKIIDAADGLWDVLDALWNLLTGLKDTIFSLFTTFFPFVPAPVSALISVALFVVLIAGLIKLGRK